MKKFRLFLISFFVLLKLTSVIAQDSSSQSSQDEVIRIESKLVVVSVSVIDKNGNPLSGLTKDDFIIKEENKPQLIDSLLQAEETPLEIAVLFDVSATTEPIYNLQREALIQFLSEVTRPEDHVSIFLIGTKPLLLQQRTDSKDAIKAISQIYPSKQYTALYDTIALASEYINKNAPPRSRKMILAITDGEDTNSQRIASAIQQGYKQLGKKLDTMDSKSLYELTVKVRDEATKQEEARILRILQNADIVFYSINLSSSSYELNQISQRGQKTLQKLAEETGGTAYLSGFLPTNLKNPYQNAMNERLNKQTIAEIFRRLTNELRKQYVLQYYSEGNFPKGQFVKLTVELKRAGNFQLKARKGYFVEAR
ncbi:MAG: VWA domain-containing protein [Acidobacteria bacterium]|nr:MAG: VWA domain-containing protein [Acidobacteriota bacterium]